VSGTAVFVSKTLRLSTACSVPGWHGAYQSPGVRLGEWVPWDGLHACVLLPCEAYSVTLLYPVSPPQREERHKSSSRWGGGEGGGFV